MNPILKERKERQEMEDTMLYGSKGKQMDELRKNISDLTDEIKGLKIVLSDLVSAINSKE